MKISIITINFNNCSGLEKTIKSVVSQTLDNVEYIIIDGGSTDGSAELIKNYSDFISFWVCEPDTGIYNAMNKGIANATGDYLIFLNSGDCFSESNIVQKCSDYIKSKPNADIYYGDIFVVNDKRTTHKWLRQHPIKLSLDFFKNDTINHQASLIKAKLFNEVSMYPEQYYVASDHWFFLKCLLGNYKFEHLGFTMVDYDLNGISFNNYENYSSEKQHIWECLVPECVKNVMVERDLLLNKIQNLNDYITGLKSFSIIRTAINLNKKYQKFKTLF